MLQLNEVKQRFSRVEQSIDKAVQACRSDSSVPQDLKDSIMALDNQSDQASQVIQSQDEGKIRQCIDDLEQLSDRAKQACQQAGSVSEQTKNAVMQAHQELSQLKHQVH